MDSDEDRRVLLRGAPASYTNYVAGLRTKVAIDWKFDSARSGQGTPVTRLDGTKFSTVWKGKEPNDMVRNYLRRTNALPAR